ncbi:MAG: cell division protein FtsK, partial [Halieaceae bacterium]|nr:cell division protein FtsK [Halieaceae bacterium]
MSAPRKSSKSAQDLSPESRGPKDALFIAIGAACLLVLLALVSHNSSDPGWSSSGGGDIQNLAGITGAFLSDVLFSLLGYGAFLIPGLLGYQAVRFLFVREARNPTDWTVFGLRALGLILVVFAATSLAALNDSGNADLPQGAGGILGASIGLGFDTAFSSVGARLLLLAVFFLGITIFADISWLRVIDELGSRLIEGCARFWNWLLHTRDRLADRRERREREKQQVERKAVIEDYVAQKKKNPPKIKAPEPRPVPSQRIEKERQKPLFDTPIVGEVPPLDLLDVAAETGPRGYTKEELESLSRLLELKLQDFGVTAEVTAVYPGPVVTRFEIQPAAGVKVSRISNLAKDLARSLAVISVRVVEVIPGKSVVGIEIPNADRQTVNFKEVLASQTFDDSKSNLTLALGHDIAGAPIVADLGKMPHLLVAGTTGSGKSVGVNCMLVSLLFKSSPEQVRLILIDPKMLELSVYDGIPHLLTPVITDMKDAANGLRWCVAEMERRYKLMALLGVRNLAGYNRKVSDAIAAGAPIEDPVWKPDQLSMIPVEEQVQPTLEPLPSIVVVIDEFADMMMIVGKK